MTNEQRRKRINVLKEMLTPLESEKFRVSFRYNFLFNLSRHPLSPEQQHELDDVTQELKELNNKIRPIFQELRSIQIKYFVEYDGVVSEGGIAKTVLNKKEFYLSTDADIDFYNEKPDLTNPDVLFVINELKDSIYQQEYSEFTIQNIKRLS